ncbi:adenosine receptor A2b-like [Anneissia japonica]|uniref:adenosine receptor A2b-like n=1 Tax=Anneissia japonica TaxID=1529436 RepID=UPI001425516F|nr:adenosine receptor A2b-like [Anneissia japonica]
MLTKANNHRDKEKTAEGTSVTALFSRQKGSGGQFFMAVTIDLLIQQNVSVVLFIFVICTFLPVMLVTIVGNLIVILSVYRKSASTKTSSSIFISSLALFDFLTGLIGVPLCMVAYILRRQFLYNYSCGTWYFMPATISVTISGLHLMVITIDRVLAIKYPLRYRAWMPVERAIRICICVSLLGFFLGGSSFAVGALASLFVPPPNVTYEYECGSSAFYDMYGYPVYIYLIPIAGLTIPIMFILYAYIFSIASKKAKDIATRHGKKFNRREIKVTKTTAIVLLVYTLCVAPTVLKSIVHKAVDNGSTWLVWYLWLTDFLILANSMVNPLIYAGRSKDMKKEFKETFTSLFVRITRIRRNNKRGICVDGSGSVKAKSDAKASIISTDLRARFPSSFENTGDVSVHVL